MVKAVEEEVERGEWSLKLSNAQYIFRLLADFLWHRKGEHIVELAPTGTRYLTVINCAALLVVF